jgi:hypothetical protein
MRQHQSRLAACAQVTTLVLLSAGVAGCGSDPASALEGSWSGHCSHPAGPGSTLTTRFDDKGRYSSSSTGSDGETAGTYTITAPATVAISNHAGTHTYHYEITNDVLTLAPTAPGPNETCNLAKQ